MRQTELLNMQEVISYGGYDQWLSYHTGADTKTPMKDYIRELCEEHGYDPMGDDMRELEGELMFCMEQYSKLLYAYYTEVGVTSIAEADAVSVMATLHNDMNNDLEVI